MEEVFWQRTRSANFESVTVQLDMVCWKLYTLFLLGLQKIIPFSLLQKYEYSNTATTSSNSCLVPLYQEADDDDD